jgi:hypothetical protein
MWLKNKKSGLTWEVSEAQADYLSKSGEFEDVTAPETIPETVPVADPKPAKEAKPDGSTNIDGVADSKTKKASKRPRKRKSDI